MEKESDSRNLKTEITETLTENYSQRMRDYAKGIGAMRILPSLLTHRGQEEMPEAYRNALESELLARVLADYLHEGACRQRLLELTEGSILGEALPSVYEQWDEELSSQESREMLAEMLEGLRDHIDDARESLLQSIQDENRDVEKLLEDMLFNNDSMNRS